MHIHTHTHHHIYNDHVSEQTMQSHTLTACICACACAYVRVCVNLWSTPRHGSKRFQKEQRCFRRCITTQIITTQITCWRRRKAAVDSVSVSARAFVCVCVCMCLCVCVCVNLGCHQCGSERCVCCRAEFWDSLPGNILMTLTWFLEVSWLPNIEYKICLELIFENFSQKRGKKLSILFDIDKLFDFGVFFGHVICKKMRNFLWCVRQVIRVVTHS